MRMARARRTTNKNNIVILCEGTETEVRYFKDLREYVTANFPERFSDIRIVPIIEEVITTRSNSRKHRMLRPSLSLQYYEKEEQCVEDYNKYKAQPVRYVREVQLFMEIEGYVEGWAVFDRDTFTHHAEAFELASTVDNLHIAFSSYCIEEWFLLHFERNPHPFTVSVCKDNNGKDKCCGTDVIGDCHGSVCLGGRLRECRYIPNYSKKSESIFFNYTLPRLEQCFVNAAWVRTLSSSLLYLRNPYTNIDELVKHLLGDTREHYCYELNDKFDFSRSRISVDCRGDGHLVLNNHGKTPLVLNNCFFFDSDLQNPEILNLGYIEPGDCRDIGTLCESKFFLCLIDGCNRHYVSLK